MRVQRVWMPGSAAESWTVLGDDHCPVEPAERWLAYLTSIERSPNTVNGYAHDLKDWFCFLQLRGLDWRMVQLEDLGGFLAWLGLSPRSAAARCWCCRRSSATAPRPPSTGSCRRSQASTSSMPATASAWASC